jgi:hypothetical protein
MLTCSTDLQLSPKICPQEVLALLTREQHQYLSNMLTLSPSLRVTDVRAPRTPGLPAALLEGDG